MYFKNSTSEVQKDGIPTIYHRIPLRNNSKSTDRINRDDQLFNQSSDLCTESTVNTTPIPQSHGSDQDQSEDTITNAQLIPREGGDLGGSEGGVE